MVYANLALTQKFKILPFSLSIYRSFFYTYIHTLCCYLVVNLVFETPRTVAHEAPLSIRFPRQEYWSRLPFPSPGDLPNLGIEVSCIADRFFTVESLGKPLCFASVV